MCVDILCVRTHAHGRLAGVLITYDNSDGWYDHADGGVRNPRAHPPTTPEGVQLRMFTARDATTATVRSEAVDCTPMSSFAIAVRGIVSVGLNAVALVKLTYM